MLHEPRDEKPEFRTIADEQKTEISQSQHLVKPGRGLENAYWHFLSKNRAKMGSNKANCFSIRSVNFQGFNKEELFKFGISRFVT